MKTEVMFVLENAAIPMVFSVLGSTISVSVKQLVNIQSLNVSSMQA